jgi:hypothetical protein
MVAKQPARKSAVKQTAVKGVKRKVAKVTAAKGVRTPIKPVKAHPEKTDDVAMVLREVLNEYHDEVEARLARHVGGVREHFQHQVTVIAEQYMASP